MIRHLNTKNIFLLDAIGAGLSLILTGGILPLLSQVTGIPKNILYLLAIFPFVYGLYSFICYKLPERKAWMLLAIVFANAFYGVISAGLMLFYKGITFWGYLILSAEILVLVAVIAAEWNLYRKDFLNKL